LQLSRQNGGRCLSERRSERETGREQGDSDGRSRLVLELLRTLDCVNNRGSTKSSSTSIRCIVRPSHKCAAGDCRWRGCHEADDSSVDARALPPRHHVEAHRASERAYTISQVFRSIDGARGIPRQDRAERGAAAFSREKKKKVIGYGTNQTSIRDWPSGSSIAGLQKAPQWDRSPIAVRVPREPHASPIRMSRCCDPREAPPSVLAPSISATSTGIKIQLWT
jgi:hypothetical protein